MYLYISSSPTEHFPDNTSTDFTVHLPRLLTGNWKLGAIEVNLPSPPETPLFVCCDLCSESIVNERYLPVLCQLNRKSYLPANILYIPVKTTQFHTVRVYICNKLGVVQKLADLGETTATVHLLRDEAEEAEARY